MRFRMNLILTANTFLIKTIFHFCNDATFYTYLNINNHN